jgi:hypothetical protein
VAKIRGRALNAGFSFPKNRDFLGKGEIVEIMLLPDFFARQR